MFLGEDNPETLENEKGWATGSMRIENFAFAATYFGFDQSAFSNPDGPRGTLGMVFKQINPVTAVFEHLPPTFISMALTRGGSFVDNVATLAAATTRLAKSFAWADGKDRRILRFGYFDCSNIADCTKAPHAANDDEVSLREVG